MSLRKFQRSTGGNFYIRGTVAGKSVYESTGTSNRREAEAIRIRTEAQILERHALGVEATITFAEAALTYIEGGGETRFMGPILHHFGADTRLADINNAAVNRAAKKLYPNAKPATINRQLITPINAVINAAAEDGLCHPVKIRRRAVTEKKTRWLTPEEFEVFASHLSPHMIQIIGFMIGTGARVRETLTLQTSTLYLASGQALLTPEDTKSGKARMVRIPPRARDMLTCRAIPEAGSVFTTHTGQPYVMGVDDHGKKTGASIKTAFYRARKDAGFASQGPDKVTPHTIRHTWATWYYAQTRDFGALLDLGGWADADTANIYRKIAPDDLADRLLAHGWDFTTGAQLSRQRKGPHLHSVSR